MGSYVEVPKWLKELPLAPVFRPTDTEFSDPMAYISKIEKEASVFGICKIIPPLSKPSKKYVLSNLNKSLLKSLELDLDLNSTSVVRVGSGNSGSDGEVKAMLTTRHQELGQSGKKLRGLANNPHLGAHKQVWQSGEAYTLEQFESKSKAFARSVLGMVKDVSPLVIDTLFWKAALEKAIYIEYANDVPGSAFGEPEGQLRFFQRRRRKRTSYQRNKIASDFKKETDISKDSHSEDDKKHSVQTSKYSISSSRILSNEASHNSRRMMSDGSNETEGTAGWKLSNSPWNLQLISRSPGSLTRFMPDDIPGVTSPMVYIGMLFSWFAWHVEDHELHSMNFLHTGSPKTWYSVPGDHAFAFEEVIRTEAFGGNIDRMAALSLLGEKTTLLSPEVIAASGIPCCRLTQNPGEFVVTFPRAYHIGFSHGFNCGEAANFGTPQWLKVAKQAAVRRAAMNYLPMLSHQQLLYLLTMSFVSRVRRSLLPGCRSSRMKDRLKEERELLVKKAFIEDMLNENQTLSLLMRRRPTYRAVIWHPDLLPCSSKESKLPNVADVANPTLINAANRSEDNSDHNLLDEMTLYMESLNNSYLDGDDVLCDFQVDSGSLACVACGILGFPFMAVVQPSQKSSTEPFPVDHLSVQGPSGSKFDVNQSTENKYVSFKDPISEPVSSVHDTSRSSLDLPISLKSGNGWDVSDKFMRPQIFCLEHAVQIDDLLQPKGGANMLVICHSDYPKIKAHATAVTDEIGRQFDYDDVLLGSALQEDFNLIDLAIVAENHETGEDWASRLGINLRYCMKVRKNSPSKQVQHALALGGLFSERSSSSGSSQNFIDIEWHSRKSRSKIYLKAPNAKHFEKTNEGNKEETNGKRTDCVIVAEEKKLVHYTRRKFKVKPDGENLLMNAESVNDSNIEIKSVVVMDKSSGREVKKNCLEDSSISQTEVDQPILVSRENLLEVSSVTDSKDNSCSSMDFNEIATTGNERRSTVETDSGLTENLILDTEKEAENHPVTSTLENCIAESLLNTSENCLSRDIKEPPCIIKSNVADPIPTLGDRRKRKKGTETKDEFFLNCVDFVRSPCEGLRPRASKSSRVEVDDNEETDEDVSKNLNKSTKDSLCPKKKERTRSSNKCALKGCQMHFETKAELEMHRRNKCPHINCGKNFSAHKYAVRHQCVHENERPLKCTWEGCSMSFKWAWARTEHIRVHTGERPYECKVEGCGLSFRFISDFSRHRRKAGHV